MGQKKTEYERIRDVWYKKLKDSGFEDIEQPGGSINIGAPRSIHFQEEDLRQITQDYYCMAYHFLNSYEFDSELERVIWDYHTNGLSNRAIGKLLKQTKISKISRDMVWKIVSRLENIMKGLYLSV